MLMDAHCSCRSACETRELPEFSNRARVEKTRSADLVAHLLPHLHKALQQHGPHAHAYIHKHLTAPPEISPQGGHSPNRLPAKPWLPGLDTCQLTRDGCFDIDHFASMQDHDDSFRGISMQAAATKLLQPDHLLMVQAGATRHRSSLLGCTRCTAYVQPSRQTAPTKREDSVCCWSMCQDTSHLHGGCLVIVLMVYTALASLSTIMATAPDCGRGV